MKNKTLKHKRKAIEQFSTIRRFFSRAKTFLLHKQQIFNLFRREFSLSRDTTPSKALHQTFLQWKWSQNSFHSKQKQRHNNASRQRNQYNYKTRTKTKPCSFSFLPFSLLWIFNRILLNPPFYSAFALVISLPIPWIFFYQIVKIFVNFTNFFLPKSFFSSPFHFDFNLQWNFFEFIIQFCISRCHFNSNSVNFLFCQFANFDQFSLGEVVSFSPVFTSIGIWLNSSFNCALPLMIWIPIQWIFSGEIRQFFAIFTNFLLQLSFFSPIFTSISIFNRISLNWSLNCAFVLVMWTPIQWIFSCQIFCTFLQIFQSNCLFFLPFSFWFESSIQFRWILHFFFSFHV